MAAFGCFTTYWSADTAGDAVFSHEQRPEVMDFCGVFEGLRSFQALKGQVVIESRQEAKHGQLRSMLLLLKGLGTRKASSL